LWIGLLGSTAQLLWMLGAALFFAIVNSVLPLMTGNRGRKPANLVSKLIPLAGMLLLLFSMVMADRALWIIWPAILLMDALIIIIAALTCSFLTVFAALFATMIAALIWTLKLPYL